MANIMSPNVRYKASIHAFQLPSQKKYLDYTTSQMTATVKMKAPQVTPLLVKWCRGVPLLATTTQIEHRAKLTAARINPHPASMTLTTPSSASGTLLAAEVCVSQKTRPSRDVIDDNNQPVAFIAIEYIVIKFI